MSAYGTSLDEVGRQGPGTLSHTGVDGPCPGGRLSVRLSCRALAKASTFAESHAALMSFWFVMAPPGVGLILVLARLYDRGLWPVYFPQRKLEQLFQVSSVHR
jgi:hypothetical protein